MKKLSIVFLTFIFLFLPSCKNEKVNITGLYQWSEKTKIPDGENRRSIKVSEDTDGNLTFLLKDKFISTSGDANNNYLDTDIVMNSDVELDHVITVYSETTFNGYKHEFNKAHCRLTLKDVTLNPMYS